MNEIATRTPLGDRMNYAKALAEASLLPASYRKQPANVLLAMEYGDALGLSPIAAIQGVHVIDGKPTASAQLIGALVRKAGHRLRVVVAPDRTAARATITRSDDPEFEFESVWTLDRAQAAGLLGKGTWKQYPENLLKARAITEVARDACPEVLSGVAYTAEELGHDDNPTPAERIEAVSRDQWQTPGPVEVVEAEVIEAPVADIFVPAGQSGRIQRQPATQPQRQMLGRLAREAGFDSTAEFLADESASKILGGRPSEPLNKAHASALIEALLAYVRESDSPLDHEPEPDPDVQGEEYEAGR